jgi:hypothetical protein
MGGAVLSRYPSSVLNMSLEQIINAAFPDAKVQTTITDNFILSNQSLMEIDKEIDPLLYVPVYMLWCVRNKENYDQLVTDYTIDSIAYFGRTINQPVASMNLKKRCNVSQREAILAFLQWCQASLEIIDEKQVERAIKQWNK